MDTKKITFEFPADAWHGIVSALTEWKYQDTIANPAYDGTELTVPPYVPNPVTREEAAIQVIRDFVSEQYKAWAERTAMAPVQQQIQEQVQARAIEVDTATKVSVE